MPDSPPTRRTVLRTAGLVALAGGGVSGLAACASDAGTAAPAPSSAPSSAPASSPAAAPSPSNSPTPSTKPSASATKSAKLPSGPNIETSKVKVGGGVILDDANYVITQPTKGDYKAFSKICTHQGCPVTKVEDGRIKCPCHGSQFSIKDGSVVNPPASKGLKESKVTVVGGKVYVAD